MINIWDFQIRLTRRLSVWSALSVAFSALMFFSENPLWRGLAVQFFAWGVIDAGIAIFGARAAVNKRLKIQEAERGEKESQEARWLERILWINTGLDVFYVLGGYWLMQTWGAESALWRGHGLGVVIQGGFLFFFDFVHAFALRTIRTT